MSIDACASLLQKGDPDRFLAVISAPLWCREILFPLYAFNLEIARAPWAASQPLVAEMRLQWWRDVLENTRSGAAKAHEVADPLHQLIRDTGLPVGILDRMVAARRWDCWSEPFADLAALETYLDDTAGGLIWAGVRALGAPDTAEPAARHYGRAMGMANFLRAVPTLQARGRHPVPEGCKVTDLANLGLEWLSTARKDRKAVPKAAAPALLVGWQTSAILHLARKNAEAPDGYLQLSEFSRRGRLLWQATTGRW